MAILAGCASLPGSDYFSDFSWAYKVDVQQGMVVTQEMSAELRPGMTRDQVKFVVGTPLLTDPFNAQRWDYVFRFQPGRGTVEERRFSIYFVNDKLDHTAGDALPTEKEFVASRIALSAQQRRRAKGNDDLDRDDGPSLWQRLVAWFGGNPDNTDRSGTEPPPPPTPPSPQPSAANPAGGRQ